MSMEWFGRPDCRPTSFVWLVSTAITRGHSIPILISLLWNAAKIAPASLRNLPANRSSLRVRNDSPEKEGVCGGRSRHRTGKSGQARPTGQGQDHLLT